MNILFYVITISLSNSGAVSLLPLLLFLIQVKSFSFQCPLLHVGASLSRQWCFHLLSWVFSTIEPAMSFHWHLGGGSGYLLFVLTCSPFTTAPERALTQICLLSCLTSLAIFILSVWAASFKEFPGSAHIFCIYTLAHRIFTGNAPQLDNTSWLKHKIIPTWIHLANCWPQLPASASQGSGKVHSGWMNLSRALSSTIWHISVYGVCLSDTALDVTTVEAK